MTKNNPKILTHYFGEKGFRSDTSYAVNSLNLAMYPINLSAYVQSKNVYTTSTGSAQYSTPIYGGHFTLAIGDPYLISSYAAKTLWYLITTYNTPALNDESFSTSGMSDIINTLAPSSGDAVFKSGSHSALYLQWLLNSPSQAASTISTLNTAASQPVTHTSIWGKLLAGLVEVTTTAAIAALGTMSGGTAATVTMIVTTTAASTVDGALIPDATNSIEAAFTTTTQSVPVAQEAPVYINSTYASTNLFGLWLANTFVQTEIGNTLNLGNTSPYALWSNYSINTDSLCTSIALDTNMMSGACSGTANNGSQSASTQAYINVLTTYTGSYSTGQLSIWDAILTGADITTGSNNYMQVANPTLPAFSPPVQLVDATGSVAGVNVTFNTSSGLLTLASYTTAGGTVTASATHTGVPTLELVMGTQDVPPLSTWIYQAPLYTDLSPPGTGAYSYDSSTGVMTVNGYLSQISSPSLSPTKFINGMQTINMATCADNAYVVLTLTGEGADQQGSLSCINSVILGASGSSAIPPTAPTLTLVALTNSSITGAMTSPSTSQVSLDSNGLLTVTGYQASGSNDGLYSVYSFYNGSQTLDTTTCTSNTAVILSVYPMVARATSALGFLSCQSPPSLPYVLCTNDPDATGGVIAAVTGAPTATDGDGATFELGCVCIPSYLTTGGTSSGPTLGGVYVGATSSSPDSQCD